MLGLVFAASFAASAGDDSSCSCDDCQVFQLQPHHYIYEGAGNSSAEQWVQPKERYGCLARDATPVGGSWQGRCADFCGNSCNVTKGPHGFQCTAAVKAASPQALQEPAAKEEGQANGNEGEASWAVALQLGLASWPSLLQLHQTSGADDRSLVAFGDPDLPRPDLPDWECPQAQPCTCWCHCKEVNYGAPSPVGGPPDPPGTNPFMPPPPAPKPVPPPYYGLPPPAGGAPFNPAITVLAQQQPRLRLRQARRARLARRTGKLVLLQQNERVPPPKLEGDGPYPYVKDLPGGAAGPPCSGPGCNPGRECAAAAPCNCYCGCRPGVPSKDEAFR